MIVRFESRPRTTSPFDVLFRRGAFVPELNWEGGVSRADAYPYVNIADMGDMLRVAAEVPGVAKKDITIQLLGDVLTISGERKAPELASGAAPVRQEITYGKFERSFTLPYAVDAAKVTADYTDGVLHVTLPKTDDATPKAIVIQ